MRRQKRFQSALRKFHRYTGSLWTGQEPWASVALWGKADVVTSGTFLKYVCPSVGCSGRNLRRPGLGWCWRSIGERSWVFSLGYATVQDCLMLPRSPGSHGQEMFCCNPSWHVGSWSHQHTDWGVGRERRDGHWCEPQAWRFVDVNDLVSYDVYAQPLSLWVFGRLIDQWPFQPLMDKRGKAVAPAQNRPR